MGQKAFYNLIDPLIEFACAKFHDINPEKYFLIHTTCEIIRQAVSDLHDKRGSLKRRQEVEHYFKSDLFRYHCACICIDEVQMLYIVNNPDKYLKGDTNRSAA